jgi:hypothetical protein
MSDKLRKSLNFEIEKLQRRIEWREDDIDEYIECLMTENLSESEKESVKKDIDDLQVEIDHLKFHIGVLKRKIMNIREE